MIEGRRRTWNEYFIEMARLVASRSRDPGTQVGAVLVTADHVIVSTGYNGFPRGVTDLDPARYADRDEKLLWTCHAEENAIFNAARVGATTRGTTLFTTPLFPCVRCARAVVQAGVLRVVAAGRPWPDPAGDDGRRALAVLREGGVTAVDVRGEPYQLAEPKSKKGSRT